jgi:hypothetical protein
VTCPRRSIPLEGYLLTGPTRVPGSNKSFELWVTGALSAKGEQGLEARAFNVAEQIGSHFEIVREERRPAVRPVRQTSA